VTDQVETEREVDYDKLRWGEYNPAEAEANLRRARRRSCLTLLGAVVIGICLFTLLLGVAQSYIGEWLASPPAYPGAQVTLKAYSRVCLPTLAVYCTETSYQTPDGPDQVIAYYTNYRDLRFWTPMQFQAEHANPYGDQASTRYCRHVIGYKSCVQISVHPAEGGGSEIYVQEFGGSQNVTILWSEGR